MNDHVRRELDDIARANDLALASEHAALARTIDAGEPVAGGLARRRFLVIGGTAVAASAVMAACGSSTPSPGSASSTTSTTLQSTSSGSGQGDITLLRTASSLEHLAVTAYQIALGTNLITNENIKAALASFQGQHAQHAQAFEAATTQAGGTPFTEPNPVVMAQVVTPGVARLKTEPDVVALAYTIESTASQTYQSAIGSYSKAVYNKTTASILGVESRHVALLGIFLQNLGQPATSWPDYPEDGFQTDTAAVKPGTGVS